MCYSCQKFSLGPPLVNLAVQEGFPVLICAKGYTKVRSTFRSDLYVSVFEHIFSFCVKVFFCDKPCFGCIWFS